MAIDFAIPGIPEQRGLFERLAPSHYRVVVRKAQGFTAQQIADDLGLSTRTVSSYLDRAKDRLGMKSVQALTAAFYIEYAPGMWPEPENTGP